MDVRLAPYDFPLPDTAIAKAPPLERDGGRLMDLRGATPIDRAVVALPDLLRAGDLLVLNEVKVFHARIRAQRASGGAVEVMLARPLEDGCFEALIRPARRLAEGERLRAGDGSIVLLRRHGDGRWDVRAEPSAETVAATAGELPLPPYLHRAPTAEDEARYQTTFHRAGVHRAAAAPTAGLHFTDALFARLDGAGVRRATLSLEVGLGTFQPLRDEQLDVGRLHPERYVLPEATWLAMQQTRAAGGRVVAVGTTVARTLESATGPGAGATDIFLREGHRFTGFDLLWTNFHLPASSLLMLVCAFGGRERVMAAYRHAVAEGYRFYSYGDAMLVSPGN